ncbi:hypothetical protein H0H81_010244 [Sphagnurus paluster]|uniref:Uncharacterized protein n=1 Tax=Sphagnurus paluster TaxID=117069 RepID=A0A9P7GJ59_9AGAR|nr:hypothetical protein H0H81_010244 [Sphagnurus paluster]
MSSSKSTQAKAKNASKPKKIASSSNDDWLPAEYAAYGGTGRAGPAKRNTGDVEGSKKRSPEEPPSGQGVSKRAAIEAAKDQPYAEARAGVVPYADVLARFEQHFCHYCTNPVLPNALRDCHNCGAILCEGENVGLGCIAKGTIRAGNAAFLCPDCVAKGSTTTSMSVVYRMNRSGTKTYAKLGWPLLLVSIKLANLTSVPLDFAEHLTRNEYALTPDQLKVYNAELRGGGAGSQKMKEECRQFIQKSGVHGQPANTIVILDSHSDPYTGLLQTALTSEHYHNPATVLHGTLGPKLMNEMLKASRASRGWSEDVKTITGKQPWPDFTPTLRGGWRVMIVLACGSTMSVKDSWDNLCDLITRNELDLIVGFTEPSMMPHYVHEFVVRLIQLLSTEGPLRNKGLPDLFRTVSMAVVDSQVVFKLHNVVALYRSQNGQMQAHEFGLHQQGRPFGLVLDRCANCHAQKERGNIVGITRIDDHGNNTGRIRCTVCGWRSFWLKDKDLEGLVDTVHRQARSLYCHPYPTSAALLAKFANGTIPSPGTD